MKISEILVIVGMVAVTISVATGISKGISERDNKIQELGENLSERDNKIQELGENLSERDKKIQDLEKNLSERDKKIQDLEKNLSEKGDYIRELTSTHLDSTTRSLRTIIERGIAIKELEENLLEREIELQELTNTLSEKEIELQELKDSNTYLSLEYEYLDESNKASVKELSNLKVRKQSLEASLLKSFLETDVAVSNTATCRRQAFEEIATCNEEVVYLQAIKKELERQIRNLQDDLVGYADCKEKRMASIIHSRFGR